MSRSAVFLAAAVALLLSGGRSLVAAPVPGGLTERTDLDADWFFYIDPLGSGEANGWHRPPDSWDGSEPLKQSRWESVAVPHNWTLDPRFPYFGRAWYRRSVMVDGSAADRRYVLRFGPVYHRCRVFVNGVEAGAHEGGYTPFEIDITEQIRPGRFNLLAVEVDNSWTMDTLPGARPGGETSDQVFPWWPSGGLVGGVSLWERPPLSVAQHGVTSTIDFRLGRVAVDVTLSLADQRAEQSPVSIEVVIADTQRPDAPLFTSVHEMVPDADGNIRATWETALGEVELWDLDRPELYFSTIRVRDGDEVLAQDRERFGIRSFVIEGTRVLLNNEPIRLGGSNRAFDHPRAGTMDPPDVVAEDGTLLKRGSMEFSRLQHQPLSKAMLNWADENGLLVIQEAGAWQLTADQLADPIIQAKYKAQLRETVEMSRNHPCVIGWSVGNEYESWTPQGVAWTREMKRFLRDELGVALPIMNAEHAKAWGHVRELAAAAPSLDRVDRSLSSLDHQDILCINWYGSANGLARNLDLITALWPGRPVLVTEFGVRADEATPERREAHFRSFAELARSREDIIGLNYWSFNDYRSMYPGTNPDGTRPWGIVRYDRSPRPLFRVVQEEFSPLTLRFEDGQPIVACRTGFPSRSVRNAAVEFVDERGVTVSRVKIDELHPGQERAFRIADGATGVRVLSSTGVEIVPLAVPPTE